MCHKSAERLVNIMCTENLISPYKRASVNTMLLTHCGLVMAYGNTVLGQHWLR